MTDLSDLAAEVSKDLPANIRKTIDTAIDNGWELNPPGMTLCLRLNHPTDDLAQAVYVSWVVGRTPKGSVSFRFNGCSTRGLVSLSGADLLEYLQDPTVIYTTPEDVAVSDAEALRKAQESLPAWDEKKAPQANLEAMLGAKVIGIGKITAKDIMATNMEPSGKPLRVQAPGLRVQIPKVSPQSS